MTPFAPRFFSYPLAVLIAFSGLLLIQTRTVEAQFTFASDNGGNYGSWTNGSDAGTGFGGWGFTTGASSGSFLGSPANNGMGTSGIGTNAFGMYSTGSGYFSAARGFDNAMMVGDSFSFYWAMNWDANGGGKGFDLKSSGTTLFNVNNNNSSTITTTNGNADTNYGTTPMLVTVNRTSSSQYSFSMTSRSGGATYSTTISSSSAIDNFNLYIGNQNEGNGNRNIYFNNFQITNSGNYSTGGTLTSGWAYTGTGALIVGNSTTLILTNDGNTFSGGTTVGAGSTLQIGNGGASGSLPGSVVNNGAVTFNRTGDVTYNGTMSGSGVLNKQAAGALFLSGSNSYTGTTTITAGTLEAQNANALGSSANGTTVSSGAVLKLFNNSGMTIANEALSITGTGVSNGGALINTGGNNTWSGAVTLAGNTRINADTTGADGSLTVSGAISGGANALFLGAQGGSPGRTGGDIILSNSITGSGSSLSDHGNTTTSVFKDGLGALTLSGSSSFSGATLLNNGTILVGNNNAFGNGFLQVHWQSDSAKTIASTDGTARTFNNALNIYNDVTLGATDRTGGLTFNGAIALGDEAGNRTITTAAGTSHTFAGNVGGLRQIIK
ncbi:MAG: beta strand repeat-containing protein, partial [Verrucomicrobiota bacterium]